MCSKEEAKEAEGRRQKEHGVAQAFYSEEGVKKDGEKSIFRQLY